MKLTLDDLNGIPVSHLRERKGNYIVSRGFYYRTKPDHNEIAEMIKQRFPNAEIIRTWCKFVPFSGGDSIVRGSHFGVEFKLNEVTNAK